MRLRYSTCSNILLIQKTRLESNTRRKSPRDLCCGQCVKFCIVLLRKKFTKFASVQATTHGFSLCQVNHDLAFVDDSTDDDQNGDLRTQKLDYKSSYSRMKNFITSSFVVS